MKKTLLALVIGFALSPTFVFAAPALLGANIWIDTETGSLGVGSTTQALFTVSGQASAQQPLASTTVFMQGYDGYPLRISADTNSSGSNFGSQIQFRRAGGTAQTPTKVLADYTLGSLAVNGWGTTAYSASSIGSMAFIASGGPYTDTSRATYWVLYTTPTTTTTQLERLRVTDQGFLGVGTTSPGSTLSIAGSIFASSTITAASTTGSGLTDCANGVSSKLLYTAATGLFSCGTDQSGGAGSTPGGSSGQLQFNDSSAFGGAVGLVWDKITTNLGIGSTTPWAKFTVVAGAVADELSPLFAFGTTSAWGIGQHPVLFGYATTTGTQNYARVAVGTSTSNRDQFVVAGRIYQTSRYLGCDAFGATMVANIAVTDTPNLCGSFVYDANVDSALNIPEATSTIPYARLEASFTTTVAVNEGAAIRNWTLVGPASSTPVMETMVRLVQATSTTHFIVGFTGQGGAFTNHGVPPANGVYFIASTTRQNWQAVTRKNGNETVVDTGVSTSSVASGAGLPIWQTLRVEAASSTAYFLINGLVVAQIGSPTSPATNMPTANLSPNVLLAKTQATGARIAMDVSYLRVWIASLR